MQKYFVLLEEKQSPYFPPLCVCVSWDDDNDIPVYSHCPNFWLMLLTRALKVELFGFCFCFLKLFLKDFN